MAASASAFADPIAVHCGNLFDSQTGKLLGETTVVIDGKRIVDVLAGHHVPTHASEIDLSSKTCLA